jgi:hypothetical protein
MGATSLNPEVLAVDVGHHFWASDACDPKMTTKKRLPKEAFHFAPKCAGG